MSPSTGEMIISVWIVLRKTRKFIFPILNTFFAMMLVNFFFEIEIDYQKAIVQSCLGNNPKQESTSQSLATNKRIVRYPF